MNRQNLKSLLTIIVGNVFIILSIGFFRHLMDIEYLNFLNECLPNCDPEEIQRQFGIERSTDYIFKIRLFRLIGVTSLILTNLYLFRRTNMKTWFLIPVLILAFGISEMRILQDLFALQNYMPNRFTAAEYVSINGLIFMVVGLSLIFLFWKKTKLSPSKAKKPCGSPVEDEK